MKILQNHDNHAEALHSINIPLGLKSRSQGEQGAFSERGGKYKSEGQN